MDAFALPALLACIVIILIGAGVMEARRKRAERAETPSEADPEEQQPPAVGASDRYGTSAKRRNPH